MSVSKAKLTLVASAVAGALMMGAPTQEVQAANWLMLQGTEKAGAVGRAQVWGFVQPDVQYTKGSTVPSGAFTGANMQPNMHPADLTSRFTFNVRRARIGVRGQGFPLDNKVNYFILSEFGHNGITVPGGNGSSKLSDASITLNHIPGARVRVGQFKAPGSEEGLQAVHVMDYINFTNFTDMVLFERFFDGDGSGTSYNPAKTVYKESGDVNSPTNRGSFRDMGVQVFDKFDVAGMETSYAVMVGNGNGINRMDNNGEKDLYYYLSTEKVLGGNGARRDGLKAFAWHHTGTRTLTTEDKLGKGDYDMTRSGLGFTFRQGKYRASAEYMMADGMIFVGTDGGAVAGSTVAVNTAKITTAAAGSVATSSFNVAPEEKANGYYVDFGYKVLPNVELDLRYDVINRATEVDADTRVFTTTTLGAQYFFNKKTRLVVNYEFRSADAPDNAGAATLLEALDDRVAVSMLAIF